MRLWNDSRLRLTLTRLGLEYLAILLLLGLFAVGTGANLLYLVFALMMGLLLLSGWASVRALKGVKVLGIAEGHLFARVRGGLRIRLEDRHPRRARALELHLETPRLQAAPGFLPGGERDRTPTLSLAVRPEVRGWCNLEGLELRTRFPFGFMEKALRLPLDVQVLILPHPRPMKGGEGDLGQAPPEAIPGGGTTPDALRPFRPGDSPRRVNWKRTAQRGTPWVRTFEEERPKGIHLELDLEAWIPGRDFEGHLEHLSGAVLQARIQRQHLTLVILDRQGRQIHSGHSAAWRALALAQAQGRREAVHGGFHALSHP